MRLVAFATGFLLAGCISVPPTAPSGTVRGPDGEAIQGATIQLRMSVIALICCDSYLILQITRSGPDGRYSFVPRADGDLYFGAEVRRFSIVPLHERFHLEDRFWPVVESEQIDLVLQPKSPKLDWHESDCHDLCLGVSHADCRRAAEFHFGDKTRCDDYYEWIHSL